MRTLIFFIILLSLSSCSGYKNTNEYIRFHHRNYLKVISDQTEIIIFPKKNSKSKSIIVKVTNPNFEYRKKINIQDYRKMEELLLSLNQKDIEIPKVINYPDGTQALLGITDCGSNTIFIKKDTVKKEFHACGIIKEYHGKFYEATELILKAANLGIKDVN